MRRTYARFASPPARTATSNAGDGGGVIGAKDRPGNLTGASDQQVVAWAKQGHEAAFRELVRRYERPLFSLLRSEEHTSELQSRQYLVCRLLLEKKKREQSTYNIEA